MTRHSLPLILFLLLACSSVKSQVTDHYVILNGDYNIFVGRGAGETLVNGNYNIVFKDLGISQTMDTSFVFLVDYSMWYLKDRGDIISVLRGAEKHMKQRPSLRTNVTYRKALCMRLITLMNNCNYSYLNSLLYASATLIWEAGQTRRTVRGGNQFDDQERPLFEERCSIGFSTLG